MGGCPPPPSNASLGRGRGRIPSHGAGCRSRAGPHTPCPPRAWARSSSPVCPAGHANKSRHKSTWGGGVARTSAAEQHPRSTAPGDRRTTSVRGGGGRRGPSATGGRAQRTGPPIPMGLRCVATADGRGNVRGGAPNRIRTQRWRADLGHGHRVIGGRSLRFRFGCARSRPARPPRDDPCHKTRGTVFPIASRARAPSTMHPPPTGSGARVPCSTPSPPQSGGGGGGWPPAFRGGAAVRHVGHWRIGGGGGSEGHTTRPRVASPTQPPLFARFTDGD